MGKSSLVTISLDDHNLYVNGVISATPFELFNFNRAGNESIHFQTPNSVIFIKIVQIHTLLVETISFSRRDVS